MTSDSSRGRPTAASERQMTWDKSLQEVESYLERLLPLVDYLAARRRTLVRLPKAEQSGLDLTGELRILEHCVNSVNSVFSFLERLAAALQEIEQSEREARFFSWFADRAKTLTALRGAVALTANYRLVREARLLGTINVDRCATGQQREA